MPVATVTPTVEPTATPTAELYGDADSRADRNACYGGTYGNTHSCTDHDAHLATPTATPTAEPTATPTPVPNRDVYLATPVTATPTPTLSLDHLRPELTRHPRQRRLQHLRRARHLTPEPTGDTQYHHRCLMWRRMRKQWILLRLKNVIKSSFALVNGSGRQHERGEAVSMGIRSILDRVVFLTFRGGPGFRQNAAYGTVEVEQEQLSVIRGVRTSAGQYLYRIRIRQPAADCQVVQQHPRDYEYRGCFPQYNRNEGSGCSFERRKDLLLRFGYAGLFPVSRLTLVFRLRLRQV